MAYKCGSCDENIGRKACLQCKECKLWYHSSCVGVSDKELTFLKNSKFFSYTCAKCDEKAGPDGDDGDAAGGEDKLDRFMAMMRDEIGSIKKSLAESVVENKACIENCLKEIKDDILNCKKSIKMIDTLTSAKISSLQDENHILHRRLNRADIVIRGLPDGLDDLVSIVVALGAFYNIPVAGHDVCHVCYISKKRMILAKFNNLFVRDNIMKAYFKTRTLSRRDIIGNVLADDESATTANETAGDRRRVGDRVFLNDHYSPAATRLNLACRGLLKDGIILRYKLFNADKLSAKLFLADGKESTVYDVDGCAAVRDGVLTAN